jgi:hypothetical protein
MFAIPLANKLAWIASVLNESRNVAFPNLRGTVLATTKACGRWSRNESKLGRPALIVPACDALHNVQAGTKGRPDGTNKELR